MYTVCIIDDEPIVVEGIISAIPFTELGFQVLGWEYNGIKGLDMLRKFKPDIVIIDIRMPGLSGLEVMSRAQEEKLGCLFIIFTGHSEFSYAKKAIELEAADYLIKPVNPQEIIQTLRRAAEKVSQLRQQQRFGSLAQEAQLLEVINGKIPAQDNGPEPDHYSAAVVEHEDGAIDPIRFQALEEMLRDLTKDAGPLQYHCLLHQEAFLIICVLPAHYTDSLAELQMHMCRLTEQLIEHSGKEYYSGTADAAAGLHQLKKHVARAMHAASFAVYTSNPCVSWADAQYTDKPIFHSSPQEAAATIFYGQQDAVDSLEQIIADAVSLPVHPDLLKKYLAEVMQELYDLVQVEFPHDPTVRMFFTREMLNFEALDGVKHPQRIREYFMPRLEELKLFISKRKIDYKTLVVNRIQEYIRNTLPHPVTLSSVSEYVHMHPSYVSRMYKQVTGTGLAEYITLLRMDRARELLRGSTLKISEIALRSGFDNQRYFSRVFKQHFNMTPGEYRDRFHYS